MWFLRRRDLKLQSIKKQNWPSSNLEIPNEQKIGCNDDDHSSTTSAKFDMNWDRSCEEKIDMRKATQFRW